MEPTELPKTAPAGSPRGKLMSPAQREQWAKIRSRGRRRFVLIWGVCFWGGSCLITISLVRGVLDYREHHFLDRGFWGSIIAGVIAWPIFGWIWGQLMWRLAEKRFAESSKADAPPTEPLT